MKKRILPLLMFILLNLLLFQIGCERTISPDIGLNPTKTDTLQLSEDKLSNTLVNKKADEKALVFDVNTADPQNMSPTYGQGECKVFAVFEKETEGYNATAKIIRKFPQSNEETFNNQLNDGYILISYKSTLKSNSSEISLSSETKTALDQLAKDYSGQRYYGVLSTAVHSEQYSVENTFDFEIPYDFTKKYGDKQDIPYLLIVDDDIGKLFLYFHELSVVAVDGEWKLLADMNTQSIPSKIDSDCLYIDDNGFGDKAENLQDQWRLLFLGKNDINTFKGNMYLTRIEEKSGQYPIAESITNNCSVFESPIEINFLPFNQDTYLKIGGQLENLLLPSLTHMAKVDCQGQIVLFTASGDTVYVELPNSSYQGIFEGKLIDNNKDINRIYEESLDLYRSEYTYATVPPAENNYDLESAAIQGAEMAGIELTKEQLAIIQGTSGFFSELEGQCLWLPNDFMPLTAPIYCYEQNVLISPVFAYTEDGLWLDTIGPIYRQRFKEMRDFSVQEDYFSGHYTMEIVFRYGSKTFYIEITDGNAGADVTISMLGQ